MGTKTNSFLWGLIMGNVTSFLHLEILGIPQTIFFNIVIWGSFMLFAMQNPSTLFIFFAVY